MQAYLCCQVVSPQLQPAPVGLCPGAFLALLGAWRTNLISFTCCHPPTVMLLPQPGCAYWVLVALLLDAHRPRWLKCVKMMTHDPPTCAVRSSRPSCSLLLSASALARASSADARAARSSANSLSRRRRACEQQAQGCIDVCVRVCVVGRGLFRAPLGRRRGRGGRGGELGVDAPDRRGADGDMDRKTHIHTWSPLA
jgi:hypothetical protein